MACGNQNNDDVFAQSECYKSEGDWVGTLDSFKRTVDDNDGEEGEGRKRSSDQGSFRGSRLPPPLGHRAYSAGVGRRIIRLSLSITRAVTYSVSTESPRSERRQSCDFFADDTRQIATFAGDRRIMKKTIDSPGGTASLDQ